MVVRGGVQGRYRRGEYAAQLAKSYLVTEMVANFPAAGRDRLYYPARRGRALRRNASRSYKPPAGR